MSYGVFNCSLSGGARARLRVNDQAIIGIRNLWRRDEPFGVFCEDRRQHMYVVGKSGTGKTTLLRNLIIQDIEAGRGVGLIDPHGDLAEDILAHIPRHRTEDVVYFDPADAENPVAFNPLSGILPERRHLVASGIVEAFKGIWPDSWGPRMEYILYAAVAAVLECQNVSLLGVQRMLSDKRYRHWVVRQVKDPMVRSFWTKEFENYDKKFVIEAVAPIQNKIGQIFMSPHLRNILGQVKSRIDARFMMDHGRIFIANLSRGKLGGDKAGLLGSLLVAQFQLAAMSRADVPESERRDFHLYVDEFQTLVSNSFASVLSEARKYRLCLTICHQYLDQLQPGILKAVLGNVGSIVSFRLGHEDAEAFEKAFGGNVHANDFTSLHNGEAYAKLLTWGQDMAPFLGKMLPPGGTRHGRQNTIIRRSREKYSRGRGEVERKIKAWAR